METIKKFIEEIKKETNINVEENIINMKNYIILQNNQHFDFGRIFLIDGRKSNINMSGFIPFGTSEDNNIYVKTIYSDILNGYYAMYFENKNQFILRSWR